MNKTLKNLSRGLRKGAPALCIIAGVASVISTVVTTVMATKKASEALDDLPEDASTKEKVKTVIPYCIAPAASAISTIGCFIFQHKVHSNRYKALMGGYAALQGTYDIYKTKTLDLAGDVLEKRIANAVAEAKKNEPKIDDATLIWVYDTFREEWFEIEYAELIAAEYNANSFVAEYGCCSMRNFYSMLNLPIYDKDDDFGWECSFLFDEWDGVWINFNNRRAQDEEHGKYLIMEAATNPIHMDNYIDNNIVRYYKGAQS